MAASLFAVNKGFLDDIEVKKVLAFEHGLHAYLKDKHAALLAKHRRTATRRWTRTPKRI